MSTEKSYNGGCFCGAVQLTVTGAPAAMGYCHCESCRHWSAGPVNAFVLWQPEAVRVTIANAKLNALGPLTRARTAAVPSAFGAGSTSGRTSTWRNTLVS